VRLHGEAELYVSGYTEASLAAWAAKVRAWAAGRSPLGSRRVGPPARPRRGGRDVFVYFDNDAKVHAPFDATALAARLGLGARLPFPRPSRRAARRRGTMRSGGRAR
jgi:uncharacterized protein YecE (DUF72 family)